MAEGSGSGMVMLFILLILGLVYFTGLAPAISNITFSAVTENNVSGVEGWFLSLGFQIITLIFFVIAVMAIGYFGLR
jgi:hypothetical protein